MNQPPTTPTPRRFLLAKRPPASQTPAPQASQQFQSTPRFGSSSVPRLAQRRAHDLEDVDEDGDESYDESLRDQAEPKGDRSQDTIEMKSDDDLMSQDTKRLSQSQYSSEDDVEGAPGTKSSPLSLDRREAKRRRVSISPAPSSSFGTPEQGAPLAEEHTSVVDENSSESPEENEEPTRQHQPVFQPAPRFKTAGNEAPLSIFPEAFSPKHRGAKYLPGGHAAQLQGWLSEVKGWEGPRHEDSVLRLAVEDVSPGEHMYLVRGRAGGSDDLKACILAGEGRLTGLDRRAAVNVGSVVMIEQPIWEVSLVGECWTVGCNWSVGM